MLTPSRLVLARTRRGLTVAELAATTGLSEIGEFEHGRGQPDAATTEQLASALGFPVGFLTAPVPAESAVAFRSSTRLSARRRAMAAAAGTLAIEFNAWLERTFTAPEPDVPTLEHPDPETAADMVRARWNLGDGPAPNMVQLLESRGVRVFSLPADCAEVGAFSFWHARTPFVFLNPATEPERARFDAAHELGRLVLHAPSEREATVFAGAFLLPRKAMTKPPEAVVRHLRAHSARWHVSALALTYRLGDIGLLTEEQYRAACTELSREPRSGTRRESSRLLTAVLRHRSAHQVARELRLHTEELHELVFGLVLTAVPGSANETTRPRGKLSLVR